MNISGSEEQSLWMQSSPFFFHFFDLVCVVKMDNLGGVKNLLIELVALFLDFHELFVEPLPTQYSQNFSTSYELFLTIR